MLAVVEEKRSKLLIHEYVNIGIIEVLLNQRGAGRGCGRGSRGMKNALFFIEAHRHEVVDFFMRIILM